MYNRYIPQSDGSYRRNKMPDNPPQHPQNPKPQEPPAPPQEPCHSSVAGFLKKLLPREFDTGDLIVVLLLLLMAEQTPEEKNTALLTLALYFFM